MNSTVQIKGLGGLNSLKRRKDLISKVKAYWTESCELSDRKSAVMIYPNQGSEGGTFVKIVSFNENSADEKKFSKAEFTDIARKISEDCLTHHIRPLRKHNVSFKGYLRGVNKTANSFNLWPSSTVDSYLESAAHSRTAEDALAKDWQNVGDDVWIGLAEALQKDFEEK